MEAFLGGRPVGDRVVEREVVEDGVLAPLLLLD